MLTREEIERGGDRLYDIEPLLTINGEDEYLDMVVVYRLNEPSCFSWEPGELELIGLWLRVDDRYYPLPPAMLGESQWSRIQAEICGETDDDILEREQRQSRDAYMDRRRSA